MKKTGASQDRPRIVLVTGAPGSGKTTLGTKVSRALQISVLARDGVRRGLFFTNGAWGDRPGRVPTGDDAVEAFLRILEAVVASGVSCIVEYVVGDRETELRRIASAGDCVVALTECRDALERSADRHGQDRLLGRRPVLDVLGYSSVDDHLADAVARMRSIAREMRTEFDVPVLKVRTDDGYEPGLDSVLEFVTRPGPRPGRGPAAACNSHATVEQRRQIGRSPSGERNSGRSRPAWRCGCGGVQRPGHEPGCSTRWTVSTRSMALSNDTTWPTSVLSAHATR